MNVYNATKKGLFWAVDFVFFLTLVLNFFKVGWDSLHTDHRQEP